MAKQKQKKSFKSKAKQNKSKRRRQKKTVTMPRAKGTITGTSGKFNEIRVKHKEFITDLVTDQANSWRTTLEVNPGLESCFPWLSRIAAAFENYVFNSLTFNFITAMGTNNNGAIALVPDYDPDDDNTNQDKTKLMSYADSKRGPIWYDLAMKSMTKNLRKKKEYVTRLRSTTEPKKLFDVCSLIVLVTGLETATNVGELWVEYDITLITPQLEPEPTESMVIMNEFQTSVSDPFMYGVIPKNTIGGSIINSTRIQICEKGDYLMEFRTGTTETCGEESIYDPTVHSSSKVTASIQNVTKMETSDFKGQIGQWVITAIGAGISLAFPLVIEWLGLGYGNQMGGHYTLRYIDQPELAMLLKAAKAQKQRLEKRKELSEKKETVKRVSVI